MIHSKRHLCTVAVFLIISSAGYAQQQVPDNSPSNLANISLPDSYIALAGEGTFSTFGAAISFPVYWVEDRVKVAPLFGLMWQNFVEEGINVRPATGAKFLYYFQKKSFGLAPVNSFYAGLGGMGTINQLFGGTDYNYTRAGAILGYNFSVNRTVRLAPELFLGVDQSNSFRAEIGFALYFER
jgi:hypothetical protein